MRVRLSGEAARDIDGIYSYGFLNFGEAQADLYFVKMRDCLDILCANPEIGRLDTRVHPAIRRFAFESHVIFYDTGDDGILIIRVLHESMDFLKHLGL